MSKRYQGGILGAGFNPLRAPNAPTNIAATGGCSSATVTFVAPTCTGGGAITGYAVRSNPGGFGGTAAGSPVTVSGLSNNTSYTFGVFALNGYGPSPASLFSNSIIAGPTGTFAIFAIGCSSGTYSATRNKYTYSGDVVGAATSATSASALGSATGNSTVGIFTLSRLTCGSTTSARNKYTYPGCTVTAGGAATAANRYGAAAGNSTVGIFAMGEVAGCCSTLTNKYVYSGDVVSVGTNMCTVFLGAAAGNSTAGIFAMGIYRPCISACTARRKYTYASCTMTTATSASCGGGGGSATGNSTVGIFAMGNGSNTRNKYTYSGDTNTTATASTASSQCGAAAGNSTVGIFALGFNTTRNKYTYSGDTNAAATASTVSTRSGSAASNGTTGVNI
jgi:hypothetical protein